MAKFTNNTYIIIPVTNASSQQAELNIVDKWVPVNSLKANPAKYPEIIIEDSRKRTMDHLLPPLLCIAELTIIKVLGMTFTNSLSIYCRARPCHHQCVWTRTVYACSQGFVSVCYFWHLITVLLIYWAFIIIKLLYASNACAANWQQHALDQTTWASIYSFNVYVWRAQWGNSNQQKF